MEYYPDTIKTLRRTFNLTLVLLVLVAGYVHFKLPELNIQFAWLNPELTPSPVSVVPGKDSVPPSAEPALPNTVTIAESTPQVRRWKHLEDALREQKLLMETLKKSDQVQKQNKPIMPKMPRIAPEQNQAIVLNYTPPITLTPPEQETSPSSSTTPGYSKAVPDIVPAYIYKDDQCKQLAAYAKSIALLKSIGSSRQDLQDYVKVPTALMMPIQRIDAMVWDMQQKTSDDTFTYFYNLCQGESFQGLAQRLKTEQFKIIDKTSIDK